MNHENRLGADDGRLCGGFGGWDSLGVPSLATLSEDSLPVIFPILTNRLTFLISTFLVFHKTGLFSNSRQVANKKLWLSLKAGTFLFHSMSTRPNRECQRNITMTLNGGMATDHSCDFYVIKLLTGSDKISNWDISQKCPFFNQSEKCQNGGIVGALERRWVPERIATGSDRGNGGVVGTGAASEGTRCTDGLQLHSLPSPLHYVQFVKYIFPRNRTTSN